jgi:hypothetical protein
MLHTKCVWQFHDKKDDLAYVFDYFRLCTNEAIRISDEKNLTSRNAMNQTELQIFSLYLLKQFRHFDV